MEYGNQDFLPVILGTALGAYGIARSLNEAYSVRSLALGRAALPDTADSDIVKVRAYDHFDEPDFVIDTLQTLSEENPDRTVLVIPTIELYTNILIERRHLLAGNVVPVVCQKSHAEMLMTKSAFYETCAALGVPHPQYKVLTYEDSEKPDLGEDLPLPYPAIVKPSETDLYPRLTFEGRKKVYKVQNPAQLRQVVKMVFASGYREDMLVQEFLPGNETVMQSVNTYSDSKGRLRVSTVGQIILADQSPTFIGNNDAIATTSNPKAMEDIRRLLDDVGYQGLGNFDLMEDKETGEYKLLEMNLRLSATSYYTTLAGANMPQAFVEDLVYGREPKPLATDALRLWLNVPYWVAEAFSPKPLRPMLRAARKGGSANTLWYRPDLNPKRVATLLKISARQTLSVIRNHDGGINR